MRVQRSVLSPESSDSLTWDERWNGPDRGLIAAWERGLAKAREVPEVAAAARAGELVVLPWKGGVERSTKAGQKVGVLYYYAMWLGLRGEDLDLSVDDEPVLTCSKTRVTAQFTFDSSKYANS